MATTVFLPTPNVAAARRPLASTAGLEYVKLDLGVPMTSAVAPGQTQVFVCDLDDILRDSRFAALTIELERESGDPVLMASRNAVPSCDPLRTTIVDAHAWDERAFDSNLAVHRVRLAAEQLAEHDRVIVGVFNFYGVVSETARVILRADVESLVAHDVGEIAPPPNPRMASTAGPAHTPPVAMPSSAARASRTDPRRLEGRGRYPHGSASVPRGDGMDGAQAALDRRAALAQPRATIADEVRAVLARRQAVANSGRSADHEWAAHERPEVLLRGLLHQYERLKAVALRRALLSAVLALWAATMRTAWRTWERFDEHRGSMAALSSIATDRQWAGAPADGAGSRPGSSARGASVSSDEVADRLEVRVWQGRMHALRTFARHQDLADMRLALGAWARTVPA